jgi:tetratricopeptide (TPR) repeat protein
VNRFLAALTAAVVVVGLWLVSGPQPPGPAADEPPPIRVVGSGERDSRRTFWETFRAAVQARDAGRLVPALAQFERALALDPRHEQSLYESANLLFRLRRHDEALARFRQLFALHPEKSNRALLQIATLLSTTEPGVPLDLDEAMRAATEAARRNREETGPFLALARVSLARGDRASARRHLDVVTRLDVKAFTARLLAGVIDLAESRPADAIRVLEAAIAAYQADRPVAGVLAEGDTADTARGPPPADVAIGSVLHVRDLAKAHAAARRQPALSALDAIAPRPALVTLAGPGRDRPLLLVPRASGGLAAFRDRDGTLEPAPLPPGLERRAHAWTLTIADLDADGLSDVVWVGGGWHGPGPLAVLKGLAGGGYEDVSARTGLPATDPAVEALAADLDADGRQDLVLLGVEQRAGGGARVPPVRVFRGDGRLAFTPGPPIRLATGDARAVAAAGRLVDLNGDRVPDLVVALWHDGVRFLAGDGRAGFTDATRAAGLDGPLVTCSLAVADLDADSRPDLVAGQWSSRAPVVGWLLGRRRLANGLPPAVFRNSGGGRFERVRDPSLDRPMGTSMVGAADLDGDGLPELVFANGALAVDRLEPPVVLANRGRFRFADATAGLGLARVPVKAWGVSLTDLDADGHADLVLPGGGLAPGDRWAGAYRPSRRSAARNGRPTAGDPQLTGRHFGPGDDPTSTIAPGRRSGP